MQSVSQLPRSQLGRKAKDLRAGEARGRQAVQKQHNGLKAFDGMLAQSTGLSIDLCSQALGTACSQHLPHPQRHLPDMDRNHFEFI